MYRLSFKNVSFYQMKVVLFKVLITWWTMASVFGTEPPICGRSLIANGRTRNLTPQIKDTLPNVYPSMVTVQRYESGHPHENVFDHRLPGAFVGTILGPTIALVACSCVARHMGQVEGSTWDPKQFLVMAGTPWDYSPVDGLAGQIRFASRIVVHPRCDLYPATYLWDLAVILWPTPLQFSENIVELAPIPMAIEDSKSLLDQAMARNFLSFTAGWGWAFRSHLPYPLHVKIHPLFVHPFEKCNHSAADYINNHINPSDMHVCIETASSYLRVRTTGDVGSPLLGFISAGSSTNQIKYMVLGIKSEEDDSTPDGFALFTRIDVDLDWVWNMKRNPPDPRGTASAVNISLQVLLILNWTRIWDIFEGR